MDEVDSAEAFLDHFSYVISFLNKEGFTISEKVLLQEFEAKYPPNSGDAADEEVYKIAAPGAGSSLVKVHEPVVPPKRNSSAHDAAIRKVAPGMSGSPAGSQGVQASRRTHSAHPPPAQLPSGGIMPTMFPPSLIPEYQRRLSRTSSNTGGGGAWEPDEDEYENMDDVGYLRRDVSGQMAFADTELEKNEEGSSEQFFTHPPGSNAHLLPEGVRSKASSLCGTPNNEPFSPLDKDSPDQAWDLGPLDITITEPVTTPTKADKSSDEPKPVLSRVESLSSSFMDFDIERAEEELGFGKQTAVEAVDDKDQEEIVFSPSRSILLNAESLGLSAPGDQPGFTCFKPASMIPLDSSMSPGQLNSRGSGGGIDSSLLKTKSAISPKSAVDDLGVMRELELEMEDRPR
eukprot:gene20442-27231_t